MRERADRDEIGAQPSYVEHPAEGDAKIKSRCLAAFFEPNQMDRERGKDHYHQGDISSNKTEYST